MSRLNRVAAWYNLRLYLERKSSVHGKVGSMVSKNQLFLGVQSSKKIEYKNSAPDTRHVCFESAVLK